MKSIEKSIGPVPQSIPEDAVPEAVPFRPLVVNRSDPDQQSLADKIGWPEVERIARSSQLPGDLQRGPFDAASKKKRKRGPVIEPA